MAKASKTQAKSKPNSDYDARRTRNARILFAILCIIIILSMALSLIAKF
jgi:predicted nucleic acid-binding Zn ribbon protein